MEKQVKIIVIPDELKVLRFVARIVVSMAAWAKKEHASVTNNLQQLTNNKLSLSKNTRNITLLLDKTTVKCRKRHC